MDDNLRCRVEEVDGVSILVRGEGELADEDRAALAELVEVCRHRAEGGA